MPLSTAPKKPNMFCQLGGGSSRILGTEGIIWGTPTLSVPSNGYASGSVYGYGTEDVVWDAPGVVTILTDGSSDLIDNTPIAILFLDANGKQGAVSLDYYIRVSDGRNGQSESGRVSFAYTDTRNGIVCSTPAEISVQAVPGSHLYTTWSIREIAHGRLEISINADTSLVPTAFDIDWWVTSDERWAAKRKDSGGGS